MFAPEHGVVAFNALLELTKRKSAIDRLAKSAQILADELKADGSDTETEDASSTDAASELLLNRYPVMLPTSPTSKSSLGAAALSQDGGGTNEPTSLTADLRRVESAGFWANDCYEPLSNLAVLVQGKDKAGNTALHHSAFVHLPDAYTELTHHGANRWKVNQTGETPQGLLEGVRGPPRSFQLHHACRLRGLVSDIGLIPYDLPEDFDVPVEFFGVVEKIKKLDAEEAILICSELANDPVASTNPRYLIYRALATLCAGYGSQAAMIDVEDYLSALASCECSLDPCYFYVLYAIWKLDKPISKSARGLAASALAVLRLFPTFSKRWLLEADNVDIVVAKEEAAASVGCGDDVEDDEEDVEETLPPDAPENEWKMAKFRHNAVSPSMDELMKLTGLNQVKTRAMEVYKATLLDPFRPKSLDDNTTMNFLFIGNPGCGKTTVARLLSAVMVELGFRKNRTPVETNAGDILKEKDPVGEFEKMVEAGKGGTIFIDEAYLLKPAPRGSQTNASNAVLDYLLKVCETYREHTTFILAGYKEDILNLLAYNEGFPSRFPKVFTFVFEDYTAKQLRKILVGMVKDRGFKFEHITSCGVSLSSVMANRIARGRGAKGFGNAREVRSQLEAAIGRQKGRLGTVLLQADVGSGSFLLSTEDHRTLMRKDAIGDRPNLEESVMLRELDSLIGLVSVKKAVHGMMQFQLQNYDREMRGEVPETISLNRVFYGNPGTGKTTVARLYGCLLREFGLLTDGDLIEVTASDLMGDHVGAGATKTNEIIGKAKGKVLFIDEAYVLDPLRRGGNAFGGSVLDTLVEKIQGAAGADMAVIMAGYEGEMNALFRNCANPGLARRFNLSEALRFDDFNDAELREILKRMVGKERLVIAPQTAQEVVPIIARGRRMDGFGNAGAVETFVGRAKVNKAARMVRQVGERTFAQRQGLTPLPPAPRPGVLLFEDFITEETSAQKARDQFSTMCNMEHIFKLIDRLEATLTLAKEEGKTCADILSNHHMVFTGPPGIYNYSEHCTLPVLCARMYIWFSIYF